MTEGGQERENVNREREKLGLMEGVRKGGKKRDRNKKKKGKRKGGRPKEGAAQIQVLAEGLKKRLKIECRTSEH